MIPFSLSSGLHKPHVYADILLLTEQMRNHMNVKEYIYIERVSNGSH